MFVLCVVAGSLALVAGCKKPEAQPGSAESAVPADAKAMMEKSYSKGGVPGKGAAKGAGPAGAPAGTTR